MSKKQMTAKQQRHTTLDEKAHTDAGKGRPPKAAQASSSLAAASQAVAINVAGEPTAIDSTAPKRRGRPPKAAAAAVDSMAENPQPKKQARGKTKASGRSQAAPSPLTSNLPPHLQNCSPEWQHFYVKIKEAMGNI